MVVSLSRLLHMDEFAFSVGFFKNSTVMADCFVDAVLESSWNAILCSRLLALHSLQRDSKKSGKGINNKDVDMKYIVTFCAFDPEAGANPLWHSCILLSRMDEHTKQLEVVDNWGFYGLPTTKRDNSWANQLKIRMGLDVDLVGNHGMLRHEELRYLDLGCGLHGASFELTKEQFEQLQQKCLERVNQQENAIKEIVEPLGIKGKPPEKTRIYAYEEFSPDIYKWEKIRAQQQGREPRLQPFEIRLSWGWSGPTLAQSNTCKTQSLSLLKNVLSEEQISRLTDGGKHPTVPRYSGPMEPIYLHSTGPLRQHKKSAGNIVYYRDFKDSEVKLYWTVPPQVIEALSEDTIKLFEIDNEYCNSVKTVVRKLQRLEWMLRNATVPEQYNEYKDALINRVINHYKSFSIIEPRKNSKTISGIQGFFYSLLSLPRDEEEMSLQEKIGRAKILFNQLYMAIVDKMKIVDKYPMERDEDCILELDSIVHENPLEAVANYLSVNDQKTLCNIIGRNYCVDDDSDEEFSEEDIHESKEMEYLHQENHCSAVPR